MTNNTSSQQKFKLKQIPVDDWSIREQLCLASSVLRSGDQNWVSVSRSLKPFIEPNRPADWFSQKNCALQYGSLLEKAGAHKRKRGERHPSAGTVDSQGETPGEIILKQLTQERIEELQQIIESARNEYRRTKRELELLRGGKLDAKLPDLLKEIEDNKRKKLDEEHAHVKWLEDREKRKQQQQEALKQHLLRASQRGSAKEARSLEVVTNETTSAAAVIGPGNLELAEEDSSDRVVTPSAAATPSSPLLTSLLRSPVTQPAVSHSLTGSSVATKLNFASGGSTTPSIISSGLKDLLSSAITAVASERSLENQVTTPATTAPTLAHLLEASPAVSTQAAVKEPAVEVTAEKMETAEPAAVEKEEPAVTVSEDVVEEVIDENKQSTEEIVEEIIQEVFGEEVITEMNLPEEVSQGEQPERFETPLPVENPPSNYNIEVEIPASSTPVEEMREESIEIKEASTPVHEEEVVEEGKMEIQEPESEEAEEQPVLLKEEEISVSEEPAETEESPAPVEKNPEPEAPEEVQQPEKEEAAPQEEPVSTPAAPTVAEERPEEREARQGESPVVKQEVELETSEETPARRTLRSSRKKTQPSESETSEERSGPTTRRSTGKVKAEEAADGESEEAAEATPVAVTRKKVVPTNLALQATSPAPSSGLDSVPNSPTSSVSTLAEDEREYRAWKKSIMLVWREIASNKNASLFAKPITDEQAPGYRSIVRRPMDLATIRKNIETGAIRTTAEFYRDVTLMFVNAIMYNASEQDVCRMAKEMHTEVNTIIQEYINTQLLVQTSEGPRSQRRETRDSSRRNDSISSHEDAAPAKAEEAKPTRAAAKRASIALGGEESIKKRR